MSVKTVLLQRKCRQIYRWVMVWGDFMILTDCFLTRVKKMRLSKRHHEARSRAHLQNLAFQLCWRSTCLSNALPLKAVKKRALKTLGSSVGLAPPGLGGSRTNPKSRSKHGIIRPKRIEKSLFAEVRQETPRKSTKNESNLITPCCMNTSRFKTCVFKGHGLPMQLGSIAGSEVPGGGSRTQSRALDHYQETRDTSS
jgi:hypothetical protein